MLTRLVVFSVLLVTPGHGRQPAASFLSISEHDEILLSSETQSAFTVSSRYVENESRSYIVVSVQDEEVVQVVNVTRSTPNATHFLVVVKTQGPGETALKVQLWDLKGTQHRLVEESEYVQVTVVRGRPIRHLPKRARDFTTLALIIVLPVVLLNKCAFGCKIELETLRSLWRKPLPVLLGAAIQFIFLPFWGFLLTRIWQLPQALAFGFILTCTCPGGGGGYLYALLLEGDITLAISMTCSLTMLSLFTMPINSYVYSHILGLSASLHIPLIKMMATLLSIAAPISVGVIIKQRAPQYAQYLERIIRPLTSLIVVLGIYLGVQMGSHFLTGVQLDLLLIGLLIPLFGLLLGHLLSSTIFKMPGPVCKTVAIESGVQNAFLALAVIQLSFPQAEADMMSVAPFLVALSAAGEMLLIVLVYNTRKKSVRLD
ncbi:sodium/bile acid cotransporter 5 [Pleurodeles waltl]|uniref:sodium/bile acid cotransporter 5 n=1 Tax=Pleurodeles waltl TaxID=8319 RepID=UPI003709BD9E